MNEQKLLRYGAIVIFTIASLALAVTLAVQVTLWAGLVALVIPWGLIALHLVRLERERIALESRAPVAEPFAAVPWKDPEQA